MYVHIYIYIYIYISLYTYIIIYVYIRIHIISIYDMYIHMLKIQILRSPELSTEKMFKKSV